LALKESVIKMIKYSYFKVTVPGQKRSGYISMAIDRPGKDNPDQTHSASFAFCSPKEITFVKSVGRNKAKGLLSANSNSRKVTINTSGQLPEVAEKLLKLAIEQDITPSWVNKAYKRGNVRYGLSDKLAQKLAEKKTV
jgi:hypothetical protein